MRSMRKILTFLLIGLTAYLIPASASIQTQSDASEDNRIAIVSAIQGRVFVYRSGMYASRPVQVSDALFLGDLLQVDEKSGVTLELKDESVMRIVQNTMVTFKKTKGTYTSHLSKWQSRRSMK